MNFELNEEQKLIQQAARDFARTPALRVIEARRRRAER